MSYYNSQKLNGIRIIQHNTARSTNAMISTLEYIRNKAEIVLFQEPWINQNDFTTISHPSFLVIIPKPENLQINGSRTKIRVLTFIKKNIPVNIIITPRLDIINDLDV